MPPKYSLGVCENSALPKNQYCAEHSLAKPAAQSAPSAEPLIHKHRCMRCDEEFDCQTPDICQAKYDVMPMIVTKKENIIYTGEHCPFSPNWDWIRAYAKRYAAIRTAQWVQECEKIHVLVGGDPSEANAQLALTQVERLVERTAQLHSDLRQKERECSQQSDFANHWSDLYTKEKTRAETAESALATARQRIEELELKLNTPEINDFRDAVVLEAVHQRERWGADHDLEKADEDWFWTLGYLAGKALNSAKAGDSEKLRHHQITSAALLANWHRVTVEKVARALLTVAAPEQEKGEDKMKVTVGNAIAEEIFDDVLAVSVSQGKLSIDSGQTGFTRERGDWYRVAIESDLGAAEPEVKNG